MKENAVFEPEDGRICQNLTRSHLQAPVPASGINGWPPGLVVWVLHFGKLRNNLTVRGHLAPENDNVAAHKHR
jgi:hypothetical protein